MSNISNAEDGTYSSSEILNDPVEHTYTEQLAIESHLRLSAKYPSKLVHPTTRKGKILKTEKVNRDIFFGKNLYES